MYRLCSRHYHLEHYNTNFTHFEAAALRVAAAACLRARDPARRRSVNAQVPLLPGNRERQS
jgi:hypothetical protein